MKRKIFALILAAAMVFAMLPLTVSAAFADTAGHWAQDAIARWADLGVLDGYSDGTFRPEDPIKRGEFFKIIDSVMGYNALAENRFADLKASDWYYESVLRLAAAGVVTGDASGTVRGEADIKREEAFAVLARVFHVQPDAGGLERFLDADKVSAWAREEVGGLAAAGYVQGYGGYLNPQAPIVRAEVVTVLDNLVGLYMGKAGTYRGRGGIALARASGAVLNDAEFEDLYVTQGVGSGDFTLVNSKITGTLYVSGGAIRIIGSEVGRIVVSADPAAGDVRLAADARSRIPLVCVEDGGGVILDGNFGRVVVAGRARVTVAEGAAAGAVDVLGDGAEIVVSGEVGSVTAAGRDVRIGGPGLAGRNEVIETAGSLAGDFGHVFAGGTQLKVTGLTPGRYDVYVRADKPVPERPEEAADALLVPELKDLIFAPDVEISVWRGVRSYADFVEDRPFGSKWRSEKMLAVRGLEEFGPDLVILAFKGGGLVPPERIAGFGGAPATVESLPGGLGECGWFSVRDGDLLFVALYPEPEFAHPVETEGGAAGGEVYPYLYEWPVAEGSYDPALDGKGIQPGTKIYSCYDFDWSTYTITRTWNPPQSIEGYRPVSSPEEMVPGTWCALSVGSYSYLLIMEKALLPADRVMGVDIGAQVDLEFKARDTVTMEAGKSLNLTALLSSTGKFLREENRAVTWTVARAGQAVPLDEQTARITVVVTEAAPFAAQPAIRVRSGGVREWDEDPVAGEVYLGFTSDVHYDKNATAGESLFGLWMKSLAEKGVRLDYMAMLGDNLSAYSSTVDAAWQNIMALMELADAFKGEGRLVRYDNLFLAGNHEQWEVAGASLESVRDNDAYKSAVDRIYETGEDPIVTERYAIVPFGARSTKGRDVSWYGAEYGAGQGFLEEDIERLEAFLARAPKDIPIFVLSHYPLHTYVAPEGGDRATGNALELVRVFNKYPNVIFLWGHNHSSADPMYDRVLGHGDYITLGPGIYGETFRINFTYAAAGSMNDIDYRSSASSDSMPGGVYVKGKGMLAGISGDTVSLMWYAKPAQEIPALKLPEELKALEEAASEKKVWLGAAAYRSYEEAAGSDWYDPVLAGWAKTGSILGGGKSVVVLGYKGEGIGKIAGGLTALTGYDYAAAASRLSAGSWSKVVSADGSKAFVLLYTFSDGAVWLPKYVGDAEVVAVGGNKIVLKDRDEDNGTWTSAVTWEQIVDAVSAFEEPVSDETGAYNPDKAGVLRVGDAAYSVEPAVFKAFEMPAELQAFLTDRPEPLTHFTAYGFGAAKKKAAEAGISTSAIDGLVDLAAYGVDVVIIGVKAGLINFASALPEGLTGYGKALSESSVSDFASIQASFQPGTWFFAYSGSASYVILYLA